jgi:hypothetical protein
VFFHLARPDDAFRQALRRYAAAMELAWVRGQLPMTTAGRINVRDLVNSVGSVCLAEWFQQEIPEYTQEMTIPEDGAWGT